MKMKFLAVNLDPHVHPLGSRHRAILAEVGAELMESHCIAEDEIIAFAKDADAILTACADVCPAG